MTKINVYLTFDGNCEEAFNFYKSVFGGEFAFMGRFADMPSEFPIAESEKNKVMHATLPIGGDTVLFGSDTADGFGPPRRVGNNFSISIDTDSKAKADELFTKLSEGGQITMPLADTFWGSYFGSLMDKYEVNWMVSYAENPM